MAFVRPITQLRAQNAVVVGTSGRLIVGTGAAVSQNVTVAAAAERVITGTGVLVPSSASQVSGAGAGGALAVSQFIPDISLTIGGTPHDMDQYISNPAGQAITTDVTGLNPAYASYDPDTRLLTGDFEGTLPGVELVVNTVAQDAAWGYGVDEDGTDITGGRGQDPVYVTNLNDGGAGSLSAAMSSGNRQVLFEVGGAIDASGTSINHDVDGSNVTVWGNTACSGNANIQGRAAGLRIRGVSNVIVKHLRIRLDDDTGDPTVTNRDCLIINNDGPTVSDVLIENVSMSGATDEMISIFNTGGGIGQNLNLYRCLLSYPIRDGGRGEGHNFGPIYQGQDRVSTIECVLAHQHSRPLFRPRTEQVHLSNLHYLWQGYEINRVQLNQGWHGARLWVEGNRYKERDSAGQGIKTPDYTGPYQGTSTTGCMIGSDNDTTDWVYFDNNLYPSLNATTGLGSNLKDRTTMLGGMTLPDDYATRFDVDFWATANITANLDKVGANPTTSDGVDDAARSSIINDTGAWIDDISEIPGMSGHPSLSSETHAAKGTFGGDTLQQHLESKSWWSTRHSPATGYTNRTKLEAYLDTFVSGAPGTDPNL